MNEDNCDIFRVCPRCFEGLKSNGDIEYCGECFMVEGDWITGTAEHIEALHGSDR